MKLILMLANFALIFMSVFSLYESLSTESSVHAEINMNFGYQAILYFCAFLIGVLTQFLSDLKALGLVTTLVGIFGATYIIYDKLNDTVVKTSECIQKYNDETCQNATDVNKNQNIGLNG